MFRLEVDGRFRFVAGEAAPFKDSIKEAFVGEADTRFNAEGVEDVVSDAAAETVGGVGIGIEFHGGLGVVVSGVEAGEMMIDVNALGAEIEGEEGMSLFFEGECRKISVNKTFSKNKTEITEANAPQT